MLKRADAGESIVDICRSTGISDTTFARWRAKYGGLEINEARRLVAWIVESIVAAYCGAMRGGLNRSFSVQFPARSEAGGA
jgi:hypothetical protein